MIGGAQVDVLAAVADLAHMDAQVAAMDLVLELAKAAAVERAHTDVQVAALDTPHNYENKRNK